ncbi:hypothetical protein ABG79_01942 [Caloramator mitchellensis]|uniref:DUF2508 domain-containing protein n=1 Tax=Caloramator mitchellensis TaxID=908809 RepID=A0A0R3JYI6_CALMK|nr:hypothetical protein [Caloramator mitchellensis]KRQ86212.1 hypothetical protein ABG79_01942 [Caloramator mitchellensis]
MEVKLSILAKTKTEDEMAQNKKLYMEEFKNAVAELENIRDYINYVDDPDLIEFAIFAEKAVEKKIAYLIKKLR